ncbi:MAG: transketolase, partial [Lachnospiraceae bacterium]|nr:transketolase [Lachnospiraceae bacterium]
FMTSFSEDLIKLEPYTDKWKAFGFRVVEIDGHNMTEIVETLDNLPSADSKQPTAIIANTIKGKGVSFMEKNLGWHAGKLGEKDLSQALAELDAAYQKKGGC